MPKRRRRTVYNSRKVRPKDKQILAVWDTPFDDGATVTQKNYPLYTWTFPGTLTGLRWNITFMDSTATQNIVWAIVIAKQGTSPSNLSIPAAPATMYSPEQNVLAWGMEGVLAKVDGTQNRALFSDKTKSMRKLMSGDQLFLIVANTQGNISNTTRIAAAIQFFNMS